MLSLFYPFHLPHFTSNYSFSIGIGIGIGIFRHVKCVLRLFHYSRHLVIVMTIRGPRYRFPRLTGPTFGVNLMCKYFRLMLGHGSKHVNECVHGPCKTSVGLGLTAETLARFWESM